MSIRKEKKMMTPNEANQIAKIILSQMGGAGRLQAMIGMKDVTSHHDPLPALSFKFPNRLHSKGNYVKIELLPSDTYRMTFLKLKKFGFDTVQVYEDIYAEQLKGTFERQTGLYLSL